MARKSIYQEVIEEQLQKLNRNDIDPRHIEAYMRLQYGTLNHLSDGQFYQEAKICIGCVDQGGKDEAEKLARSYGL